MLEVLFFGYLCQLGEILQRQLTTLHRQIQQPPLHEPLTNRLAIDLYRLGIRHQRPVKIAHSLKSVALAEETKTVVRLRTNNCTEISKCFFPLLLINVDLPSGNVSLDVSWVALQGLGQGA